MDLFIRRMRNPTNDQLPDAYMLTDADGVPFNYQLRTELVSEANELPTFTVTFVAGEMGIQVIDDRDPEKEPSS